MKKVLIRVLILLILVAGLGYGGYRLHWEKTHVTVAGTEYPLHLDTLDLSGQSVP